MKTRKLRTKRRRKIRKYKKTRRGGVKKSILRSPEQRKKKIKRRARFNSAANVTHEFRSPKLTREQKIMRRKTRRRMERRNKNQVKFEKQQKKTHKAMASRENLFKGTSAAASSTLSKNLAAKGRELAIRAQQNPEATKASAGAAAAKSVSPPRASLPISRQITPPRHGHHEKGIYTPPTRIMTSEQLQEFYNAMK